MTAGGSEGDVATRTARALACTRSHPQTRPRWPALGHIRKREVVGLQPGEVVVFADGAGLRVEAIAGDDLEERDGRLVVPSSGAALDDEMIRALRDADQR